MKIVILFLMTLSLSAPAWALPIYPISQSTKRATRVAVADMKSLFENYYKRKESDSEMRKQSDVFRTELETLNEERIKYRHIFNELKQASLDVMLSEEEREKKRTEAQSKYRAWREKEDECEKMKTQIETTIRNLYENRRELLVNEIEAAIQRRALAEGYDLVLDASGKTLNSLSVVLYASPAVDITADVLSELNRGQPQLPLPTMQTPPPVLMSPQISNPTPGGFKP